jgi:hypothetical protein
MNPMSRIGAVSVPKIEQNESNEPYWSRFRFENRVKGIQSELLGHLKLKKEEL